MNQLIKTMFFAGGTLSLIAGVIGIFVPLLPTTPFLLLAAFCYARSSERIYGWLMTNRWFGEYLKNYRDGKGIPLKLKVCKIALLWLMIGTVACFVVALWWVRLILLGIASCVTIHLIRIKTFRPEHQQRKTPATCVSSEEPV